MRRFVIAFLAVGCLAGLLAALFLLTTPPPPPASPATTRLTPATTTSPTSLPTTRIANYKAYVSALQPRMKDAETLRSPVPLDISAAMISSHPVHLDLRGDLWITHPDAPPAAEILTSTGNDQTHLTRDHVVFAFWARDSRGRWVPQPVLQLSTESPTTTPAITTAPATSRGSRYVWLTPSGPIPLERGDYRWDAAVLLRDDRVVVPTEQGICVLTPPPLAATDRSVVERFFPLPDGKTPVTVFAVQAGALAFRPWENGEVGSNGVVSLTKDGWSPLPETAGFPPQPIHIFPLTDGANLVLSAGVDGGINLTTVAPPPLPDATRDENILDLIELLNDPKAAVRTQAQSDLARFGPTAWPLLESNREAQTPEAQELIRKILGLRAQPAMGIFALQPGPVRVISRSTDGSLALYTYGGVSWFEDGEDQLKSPALLFARPGRRTQLVHESVLKDRKAETTTLQLRYDDMLVNDAVRGPMRLMGNHIAPLLREEHKSFTRWMGVDRADRWLFTSQAGDRWLILDPYLQDLTPRLPAWVIKISDGKTGWDREGHVVIQRGTSPWRLERAGWRPMEPGNRMIQEASGMTTTTALFGGVDPMALIHAGSGGGGLTGGEQPLAVLRVSPTVLFLFDRPGRALRMTKPKDADATGKKFSLDATFTEFIPATGVRRVWLDPFGRICIAHDANKVTILFPEGRIPPELQNLVRTPPKIK